jgi:hypothetical protein
MISFACPSTRLREKIFPKRVTARGSPTSVRAPAAAAAEAVVWPEAMSAHVSSSVVRVTAGF